MKLKRKIKRSLRKLLKNRSFILALSAILICIGVLFYAGYMKDKQLNVDPNSYAPLLDLIGHAESNNNYNAHFGNAGNQAVTFTDMTIEDVLSWQASHVNQGAASSAVGRYQIVNTTLSGLVERNIVDIKQKFDPPTQDRLAIALLERRGSEKYINNELTREQFAANLAMEWAALPKVLGDAPADSYYAGDGLNRSRISVDSIISAIDQVKPQ